MELQMRQILRSAAVVCTVLLLVGLVSIGRAQDKAITKKDLPASVVKAFESAYPKATVTKCATEVEKGVTFYELETTEGKIKRDLLYKADGTLAEVEEILTADMVPDAIGKAIAAEFPKGKIVSGEKTTRGKDVSFDIVVANGQQKVSVNLTADGKIQKKTVLTPKKTKTEKEEKEEGERED
jgi:hypothetical protein